MEAQQCVELTSTNRPFGLIIKLTQTVASRRLSEFAIRLREPYIERYSTFGCEPNLYASHSRCAKYSPLKRALPVGRVVAGRPVWVVPDKEIEANPMFRFLSDIDF